MDKTNTITIIIIYIYNTVVETCNGCVNYQGPRSGVAGWKLFFDFAIYFYFLLNSYNITIYYNSYNICLEIIQINYFYSNTYICIKYKNLGKNYMLLHNGR